MVEPVAKPRKDEHTLRLTSAYTAVAQRLAEEYEDSFSGILTRACTLGLDHLEEQCHTLKNKRLINRRLHAKEDGALEALAILRNPEATQAQRDESAAKIEQWLNKG